MRAAGLILLALCGCARALFLIEPTTRTYLGLSTAAQGVALVPMKATALDIKLIASPEHPLFSILSLGTQGVAVNPRSGRLVLKAFTSGDSAMLFKIVLAADGMRVLQHNDQCVSIASNKTDLELGRCSGNPLLLKLTPEGSVANSLMVSAMASSLQAQPLSPLLGLISASSMNESNLTGFGSAGDNNPTTLI